MQRAVPVLSVFVAFAMMAGPASGYLPASEPVHRYDDHSATLQDVVYSPEHDVVFSLDEESGFIAYDVEQADVVFSDRVDMDNERGHALAAGNGTVYIADGNTLWTFDPVQEGYEALASLEHHASAMDYDDDREMVWVAGHQTVYGYDADNGSLVQSHRAHTDGLSDIAVEGDHVASATTWSDEVVVYDVEAEEIVFEPDLPADVGRVPSVDVTADAELIVGTGAEEGDLVRMYDIEDRVPIAEYREHAFGVSAVEYHPVHDVIVSTALDNTVTFYDVSAGSVAAEHQHDDTIMTADLDTGDDILWFGDGEQRSGTVTGLSVADTGGDPEDGSQDPDSGGEGSEDPSTPGVGLIGGLVALIGAGLLLRRR